MNDLTVAQNNIVALAQWSDLQSRAEFLAKSELIPQALRGKPANVAIILQIGCELGISPMQAINGVTVVQGRPGVDPQLAIALIRRDIPNAYIKTEVVEAPGKEMVKVTMARSREFMDEAYTATWNMDKARKMQLDQKDNYKKQPVTMLRWRATMEAARFVFPDVIRGMYSPDELDGISDGPADKTTRLTEKFAAAKEVKAEVESEVIQPEVVAERFDPVAEYVIQAECPLKGKKLSEVDLGTLANFAHAVRSKSEKTGKVIEGVWLETITRIEQFLTPAAESTVGGEAYFNAPEEGMFQ